MLDYLRGTVELNPLKLNPLSFWLKGERIARDLETRLFFCSIGKVAPRLLERMGEVGIPRVELHARPMPDSFIERLLGIYDTAKSTSLYDLHVSWSENYSEAVRKITGYRGNVITLPHLLLGSSLERRTLSRPLPRPSRPTFVAGSTVKGENLLVLEAFSIVRSRLPEARLILAPREPKWWAKAFEASSRRHRTLRFSSLEDASKLAEALEDVEVVVVDAIGPLFDLYQTAEAAFVGGGFPELGGKGTHNATEPLAWLVPTCCGPKENVELEAQIEGVSRGRMFRRVSSAEEMASFFLEVAQRSQPLTEEREQMEAFLLAVKERFEEEKDELALRVQGLKTRSLSPLF